MVLNQLKCQGDWVDRRRVIFFSLWPFLYIIPWSFWGIECYGLRAKEETMII